MSTCGKTSPNWLRLNKWRARTWRIGRALFTCSSVRDRLYTSRLMLSITLMSLHVTILRQRNQSIKLKPSLSTSSSMTPSFLSKRATRLNGPGGELLCRWITIAAQCWSMTNAQSNKLKRPTKQSTCKPWSVLQLQLVKVANTPCILHLKN